VTEPEQNKPKVVDAEVVRGPDRRSEQSRRYVFLQQGGRGLDEPQLKRMRSRFGSLAVVAFAVAAVFLYLAATVETVVIAALFLIAAAITGVFGLFMGWLWRTVGRVIRQFLGR
jgi:hypothetical protein